MVNNTLRKKLFRDMSRAAMQFLSIIALCALGTFAFSALDGTARMTRTTLNTYYEENNLADYWISLPTADRAALDKVAAVSGVTHVRARTTVDMDTTLSDDITVSVTAYDGAMDINIPLLREGELLDENDKRGCLVEERFAVAQNLSLGSRIGVKLSGQEYDFVVRGIVVSPEYIVVSDGLVANPDAYGYLLVNACAIPTLPLTQIVANIDDAADSETVQAAIEKAVPDALVVDRRSHASTARANNEAQMFENMTLIFPVLAYAVAALIVMTTLSRMIDNQRMQMGTLKALGFSSRQIRNHYLSYALVPSAIEHAVVAEPETGASVELRAVDGVACGQRPMCVMMSLGILLYSYQKSAKECTAALLRPKPPKDGKRILFERIPFLWSRFSFNTKMVVRNLMRNKLRTFMSLVGLLCCTMLIITSFGLQDSVTAMSINYYTRTLNYDVRASLKGTVGTAESYERRLDAENIECIMEKSVSLRADAGTRTVSLTVLEDDQTMQHLGENETFVKIQPGTAAVTYKLTKTLKLSIGDTIRLYLPGDDEPLSLVIGQIVQNNVSQGVYLDQTTWESFRKGDFIPTALQLKNPSADCLTLLADMDEVDKIEYPAEQVDEMKRMLDTLSSVFSLLTGIALALAFVVCYNMGLMNFVERTREYATLKVLGYHQKEIRRLILRENNIITLIGVLMGILPGIMLIDAILHSCEPESGYYPGAPALSSIILACVITFCFSQLIQRLLVRKVRKIDMVEALKSVE